MRVCITCCGGVRYVSLRYGVALYFRCLQMRTPKMLSMSVTQVELSFRDTRTDRPTRPSFRDTRTDRVLPLVVHQNIRYVRYTRYIRYIS